MPLQAQASVADSEAPGELRQDGERVVVPRIERRKAERRGMEALRAEALQNVISQVEDRNFGGFRDKVRWTKGLKPSRIALVAVALLAGGLAAFLASQREQPAIEAVVEAAPILAPTMRVLVAKAAIGMGQRLSPATVEWQDWPPNAVRGDYITMEATPEALTDMTGAVARFQIFPGEPILQNKLAGVDQGYLSAVLGSGMRGVSVSVAADAASGGFVVPNDHVDVVLTRIFPDGQQVSETILNNARVLAINTRLGETGDTGAPTDPANPRAEVFLNQAIATLELNSTQAEVIINAMTLGKLSLVLRAMADAGETDAGLRSASNQSIRMTSPFWANEASGIARK